MTTIRMLREFNKTDEAIQISRYYSPFNKMIKSLKKADDALTKLEASSPLSPQEAKDCEDLYTQKIVSPRHSPKKSTDVQIYDDEHVIYKTKHRGLKKIAYGYDVKFKVQDQEQFFKFYTLEKPGVIVVISYHDLAMLDLFCKTYPDIIDEFGWRYSYLGELDASPTPPPSPTGSPRL